MTANGKSVLIVDDDKEWSFLLKIKLQAAGFAADQAFNGKEGLEKIRVKAPDLVLLDITMPVMNGWDVCKALRENPGKRDLAVIIQSSYSEPDDIQRGKSFKVKRYLIKPCSPDTILQNVRDVFRQT